MRQPSQGRSYYAIILHPLLNLSRGLNAPLVLSIFFFSWFVCRHLIFLSTRRFSIKASEGNSKS